MSLLRKDRSLSATRRGGGARGSRSAAAVLGGCRKLTVRRGGALCGLIIQDARAACRVILVCQKTLAASKLEQKKKRAALRAAASLTAEDDPH